MVQRIIAQKFGGTSVATAESRQRVIEHVKRTVEEGYNPVLVVSAMGRRGAPYATDTLLDMIHGEGEPVSPRDEDLIFHVGEIISVSMMSHLLKQAGLDAVGLTGGQAQVYTNGRYGRGKIVRIDPSRLLRHINEGTIPVVTGGQGVTEAEGEVNILGRGASDTSGVAVGVAVGAEKVEIYTDVPGIAITDPRVVSEARFLDEISYAKLYEIALFGARVVHPGAVLVGQVGDTPVVVRSTFDDSPGTTITYTDNEPDLVGIPSFGPVKLVVLPLGALDAVYNRAQLYDLFAAVAIDDSEHERTVVAVDPKWYDDLNEGLSAAEVTVEQVLDDKSLVSLIGKSDYIASIAGQARKVVASMDIPVAFNEQTALRYTFAIPNERTADLIRRFYDEFAD